MNNGKKRQPIGALNKKVLIGVGAFLSFFVILGVFGGGSSSDQTNNSGQQIQQNVSPTIVNTKSVLGEETNQASTTNPVVNTIVPKKVVPEAVPLEQPTYYENTYGNTVQSPTYYNSVPAGATAQCGDGTYSFSQSRRGTCSHHGGVAEWY